MSLDRGGGTALWRQIAGALEREVTDGALRPGERLPPRPSWRRASP
jgi:GntR family phosphonate transport system transcriptional regulator